MEGGGIHLRRISGMLRAHRWFLLYLLGYAVISLLFLTRFPFIHSDEPWLSGLTRNMMESGSLRVTETFFDLMPRYPHAIKTLFHLLQMPMLAAFGYRVFSFRLLSWAFGLGTLGAMYALSRRLGHDKGLSLLLCVLLSLDVQFLYASHFARQEILLLFAMVLCACLLAGDRPQAPLWAAVVTGLSIGIHPNSFVVATMCGALLLGRALREKRLRPLLGYVGVTAAFALCFVALSLWMNPNFFHDYRAYGAGLGVSDTAGQKFAEVLPYFRRLFLRESGTYYMPDIRLQLALFGLSLPIGFVLGLRRKRDALTCLPLLAILGILAGMTVIGRFGQPSVVLLFPFGYLLTAGILSRLPKKATLAALCGLCLAVGGLSVSQVIPALSTPYTYDRYLSEIGSVVPGDAKTIANLNAEYHFENGALLDWRNLAYLQEQGLSIADYVREREVQYLILSDELRLIWDLRPGWNTLYGNLGYLDDLEAFLEAHCTLVHSFVDNQYGVRMTPFMLGDGDFTVSIYRVNP